MDNVDRLAVRWIFTAAGSISVYPTFLGDRLYVTDWGPAFQAPPLLPGGKTHAIERQSGQEIWKRWIGDYSGEPIWRTWLEDYPTSAIETVFTLTNSRIPCRESSRP